MVGIRALSNFWFAEEPREMMDRGRKGKFGAKKRTSEKLRKAEIPIRDPSPHSCLPRVITRSHGAFEGAPSPRFHVNRT